MIYLGEYVNVLASFVPSGESDKETYKVAVYSGGKEVRRFTSLGKPYISRGVIRFKGSLESGEVIVMGTETVVVEKF
jgi:hypothetical protein